MEKYSDKWRTDMMISFKIKKTSVITEAFMGG